MRWTVKRLWFLLWTTRTVSKEQVTYLGLLPRFTERLFRGIGFGTIDGVCGFSSLRTRKRWRPDEKAAGCALGMNGTKHGHCLGPTSALKYTNSALAEVNCLCLSSNSGKRLRPSKAELARQLDSRASCPTVIIVPATMAILCSSQESPYKTLAASGREPRVSLLTAG